MTPPELDTPALDTARRLAENGDLDGSARIFAELAGDPGEPDRAQAAVGLAVVLAERGDIEQSRAAARTALATGHPEFAAQAACHLAGTFEREGLTDQARAAWQAVIGLANDGYLPLAHMALARLGTDPAEIERELRETIATGDPGFGSRAAQWLAERLLEDGDPGEAAEVLLHALRTPDIQDAARLRVLLGIAHLELACAEFAEAVEEDPDPETGALAIELLARALPLRGREEDAERVWAYGLDHPDERLATEVRARRSREV
jgi:tetratricopeptide (TPR) repeat protein